MIGWTLDPKIFGQPDYGLTSTTGRTFGQQFGDNGRGRYRSYNPTAPMPLSLTYGWYGDVLAQFREAWESPSHLNYGASWFRITLEIPGNVGLRGPFQYDAHFITPFSTRLAGINYWTVSMELDIDISEALAS